MFWPNIKNFNNDTYDIKSVLCYFEIPVNLEIKRVGGTRSANFLIKRPEGNVILKKYPNFITSNKINELLKLKRILKDNSIPIRYPIFNSDKEKYIDKNKNIWTLLAYLPAEKKTLNRSIFSSLIELQNNINMIGPSRLNQFKSNWKNYWPSNISIIKNGNMFFDRCENIICENKIVSYLKTLFSKMKINEKLVSFCHGDLHLGNVMKVNMKNAFIDFENFSFDAFGEEYDFGVLMHRYIRTRYELLKPYLERNSIAKELEKIEQIYSKKTYKVVNFKLTIMLAYLDSLKKIHYLQNCENYFKSAQRIMIRNHMAYLEEIKIILSIIEEM